MAEHVEIDLADEFALNGEVLQVLAGNPDTARMLVAGFRAQDHETFRAALRELDLVERCAYVCEWLCSKHCVLRCTQFCGPDADHKEIGLDEWAAVVTRLTEQKELLTRLCHSFVEHNVDEFQATLKEAGLLAYCHYICHWICDTWCGLVCDLLCRPERPRAVIACRQLVLELRRSGEAVSVLARNPGALRELSEAAFKWDCEIVRGIFERLGLFGRCRWICRWVCSWRCVRVCFVVCREFPIQVVTGELDEINEFTKALAQVPPDVLVKLAEAVEREDADTFAAVINEFGLARYCHQICAWLCQILCRRFCFCICRPRRPRPWFTHVGHFHIYGDIDSTTGLTNKGKAIPGLPPHGGPGFGFFNCLELRGFCPAASPIDPSAPMRYRFLIERNGTSAPLIGDLLCKTIVGSRTIFWDVNGTGLEEVFQEIAISGSGATLDPTPTPAVPPGTPWGQPPQHVVVPDADGWIAVDQASLGAGFNGALIGFNTAKMFPGGPAAPGVATGTTVPAANQRNGDDAAIVFEASRIPPAGPATPADHSNTLSRIHINNWQEARLLDLLQFHTSGGSPCSELSTDLDIEYTVDHELMAAWSIDINSSGTFTPGVLPSGTSTRPATVAGTHHEDISSWSACSYRVTLNTRRMLTNGYTDDPTRTLLKTFCKG